MNTLTLDQAIDLVPAIGATGPSNKASDSYQFVSSREILERVMQDDWVITGATSQGRNVYAPHRVTLVHKNYLDKVDDLSIEGIPRIEMFNSHNLTKRLLFAIGWFRTLCSNGLIVASGPAETIRTRHRFSDNRLDQIMEQVSAISNRFPIIENKIEEFKSRQLDEEEQLSFAEYAIKGRFLYRPAMPKRFRDIEHTTKLLLAPRRDEDSGNDTWQVFNRVQENLMKGVEGFSRPIRGHSDTVRVNQLLWKGADTTLKFDSHGLNKALMDLLIKDSQKGKISA
jgi:hypothetical protein